MSHCNSRFPESTNAVRRNPSQPFPLTEQINVEHGRARLSGSRPVVFLNPPKNSEGMRGHKGKKKSKKRRRKKGPEEKGRKPREKGAKGETVASGWADVPGAAPASGACEAGKKGKPRHTNVITRFHFRDISSWQTRHGPRSATQSLDGAQSNDSAQLVLTFSRGKRSRPSARRVAGGSCLVVLTSTRPCWQQGAPATTPV